MDEYSSNTIMVLEAGPEGPCRLAARVFDRPGHAIAPDMPVVIMKDLLSLAERYHVRPDRIAYEGEAERLIEENTEGTPG
jgi:hypothetical protein